MSKPQKIKTLCQLTRQVVAKLGNPQPTEEQLKLAESLLLRASINQPIYFHQGLTEREMSCLLLAAKGKTMEEVADILEVKFSTVNTWYKTIKRKLACHTIAQAVFAGIRYGYLQPPTETN